MNKRVKAALLVLDYQLYPRHQIDDGNVRSLVEAMKAGAKLPPPTIDQKTLKVIDGFHRVTAALRVDGPDAEIVADHRDYLNDGAMLEDAIRRNASHGRKLTPYDEARCLALAEQFQVTRERLADAMSVTREHLAALEARKIAIAPDDSELPIRNTLRHLAGEKLSPLQATGARRTGGMSQLFYVNQLINLLESDLLDTTNEKLMGRVAVLAGLLKQSLGVAA